MADRRMFTKQIIDSDAFLEMSSSAQALYFHLGMRADDEGFVNNPKKIQRMIGAAEDDLKILMAKRFIIGFESGIIVIKHWKMHNYIQNDRFKPTVYQAERALLSVKDNKAYTENPDGIRDVSSLDTTCIQSVSKMDTQVRIGKTNTTSSSADDGRDGFDAFWSEYPRKVGKAAARKAYTKVARSVMPETLLTALRGQISSPQWLKEGGQFIPHPATWLNQGRWEDELPENENEGAWDAWKAL
jgi:hypothetical protein